jgi:N6-L-threonylcarbamoyladenine synthase
MLHSGDLGFSFSGLKTAVLYELEKLRQPLTSDQLADLCASIQAAIVDVLVANTLAATRATGESVVAVSGGVSMNSGLRTALTTAAQAAGFDLRLAAPALTTDNAAMIAFAAEWRFSAGQSSPLTLDVDPNLSLTEG